MKPPLYLIVYCPRSRKPVATYISISVVEKGIPFTGGMTGGDEPMMGAMGYPRPPSGGSDSNDAK